MSGGSWVIGGEPQGRTRPRHASAAKRRGSGFIGRRADRLRAFAAALGRRGTHSSRALHSAGTRPDAPRHAMTTVAPRRRPLHGAGSTGWSARKRRIGALAAAAVVLAGTEVVVVATNAGAAATPVGTLAFKAAAGTTTLAVSPQHAGDLLALVVKVDSSTVTVSSVSGGGVSAWSRAEGPYTGYAGHDLEIWMGPVGTTGASTVTVGYSSSVASVYTGLAVQEFSAAGSTPVWTVDTGAGISDASSTTTTFPKLTPGGTGELYFGYAAVANSASAGSTSGFTYATTSDGDVSTYDTSVSAAAQPTAKQSPAGVSGAVGVLITATSTTSSTPTVTALSPTSGPTAGGTSVTITGTNFTGVTAVKFGTVSATPITVNSATSITVPAPAGSAATVDVTVTATGGTSATTSADRYTYTTASPGATITAVGSLGFKAANGTTTLAVSPQHTGDLLALVVKADSSSVSASSVTGGGVGAWARVEGPYAGYPSHDLEIWTGKVNTTGTSTVTVGFSGSVTAVYTGLAVQEFSSSSASPLWATDGGGGLSNASSTTTTFPKLTPSGTGELYFGYGAVANTASAGTTSGFSYATTSDGDIATYDTNVSAAVQPTAKQTPTGVSGSVAVLLSTGPASTTPTVSSVSPTSGPTAGGTSVTITGTNFTGVTAVKFGTVSATPITVNSGTSITVPTPAGSAATVDVTVTATGGTSATTSADLYTYAAAPTVSSVGPSSGPTTGGTSVTITGTSFTGVTAVKFGTASANSFSVTSTTSITVPAPAGSMGPVDVAVTAAGGTSTTSPADQFTYTVSTTPTVTALSTTSGPTAGGTSVTITGTNFTGVTAVTFGTASATPITVNDAQSITVPAPAGSGTVDVTVTATGGTSATSTADHYTYLAAPTVSAVSPSSGPLAGGTSVTITGTNFTGVTGVQFGTASATPVTVNSAQSITVPAPAGTGTVDITVTAAGGTSATSAADQFTYLASSTPTVSMVSPSSGPLAGGTTVTITGTNFIGVTAVQFGTASATPITVNSSQSITVPAPAGTGTVDITVTASEGTSATSTADHYSYATASAAISAVGSMAYSSAAGVTTLSVSPQHVGDLLALALKVSSTTVTASSVSGGGAGTWTRAFGPYSGFSGNDLEMWTGIVSTTGPATITVAFSSSVSAIYTGLAAQEFAASGSSPVWGIDTGAGISNTSSTTVTFPKLTPKGSNEVYFAFDTVANTGSAGTTSGVTYTTTSDGDLAAYDTGVSGAVQPTGTQSPAGVSGGVAVLITASSTPAPPTVSGVSPNIGGLSGGNSVTITGNNFTGVTGVKFGAVAATPFTVNSAGSITVPTPAGSGTVDITVTTSLGTSTTSSADLYTYSSVAPASLIPLGVYPPEGGGDPQGIASYAQATGTHPTLALDFGDKGDGWAGMDSAAGMASWTGSGYRLVLAVPIIPLNSSGTAQGTLATGATGAYNQYFTILGQNLVSMGLSNTILRLGWEFNGNWYAWSVANATDAANYVAYWRQIVTTMRAVPGEQFKFFWNPNGPSPTSYTPDQAYPGDAYVDYVGTDVYDNSWVTPFTPAVGWSNQLTQQWGLNWLASFAASHSKPIAIAEWSDEFRDDGHGFGDDPSFIDNMAAWFVANNVAFTDNFSYDSSSTYRNDLLDGTFPNALAEFEKDFG
jgi:hypothetical protein